MGSIQKQGRKAAFTQRAQKGLPFLASLGSGLANGENNGPRWGDGGFGKEDPKRETEEVSLCILKS